MSDIKMSDVFNLPIFNQPDVYKYGEYRNVVSDNFTNALISHDYSPLKDEADAICEAVNNYDTMQARIVELEKALTNIKRHQEATIFKMPELSTAWQIASRALEK